MIGKAAGRIVGSAVAIGFVFFVAGIAQEEPKALLVDSFNYANSEDGSLRIDGWRLALENSPRNAGLIIVYGGRTGKRGEIEAHIRGIKKAFALKGIDLERSPVVNGGYREKLTVEFWVVPAGAETPVPSPTVLPEKARTRGRSPKTVTYECCR
jgi:hypothetical protein